MMLRLLIWDLKLDASDLGVVWSWRLLIWRCWRALRASDLGFGVGGPLSSWLGIGGFDVLVSTLELLPGAPNSPK